MPNPREYTTQGPSNPDRLNTTSKLYTRQKEKVEKLKVTGFGEIPVYRCDWKEHRFASDINRRIFSCLKCSFFMYSYSYPDQGELKQALEKEL